MGEKMFIKNSVSVDEVIDLLNQALGYDRDAISNLISTRVKCNQKLADHETIQVGVTAEGFEVGMLGILNGLFGVDEETGYGVISAILREKNGNLINEFCRTEIHGKKL